VTGIDRQCLATAGINDPSVICGKSSVDLIFPELLLTIQLLQK